MEIKELQIQLLYQKHQKLMLTTQEMSEEIDRSYSAIQKIFATFSEKEILEKLILPRWKKVGKQRYWAIEDVVAWTTDTVDIEGE